MKDEYRKNMILSDPKKLLSRLDINEYSKLLTPTPPKIIIG